MDIFPRGCQYSGSMGRMTKCVNGDSHRRHTSPSAHSTMPACALNRMALEPDYPWHNSVMSTKNTVENLWKHVHVTTPDSCWPWTGSQCGAGYKERIGYGHFSVSGRLYKAHRVAWELVYGPIPSGLHVLHACDFKPCCNPAHLHLGTHQQNMRERDERGLRIPARGEGHGSAKLTAQQVTLIRQLLANGFSQDRVAKQFAVSQVAISHIHLRRNWKHVI